MSELYIGLMSGTSVDGIDAALVDFSNPKPQLIAHHYEKMPEHLRAKIMALLSPGSDEINRMAEADILLGKAFAKTANALLQKNHIFPEKISAIGSHGQNIRHHPHRQFTLQIADPNVIAAETGITTVADFRRRDLAHGGQGAPLVPAFHREIFHSDKMDRVIVNIGGIANITLLPADKTKTVFGFDTGPGNTLLDMWTEKQLKKSYDEHGSFAAQGVIQKKLLEQLLADPYFQLNPPKSTGREYFNLAWLEKFLSDTMPAADVQTTLAELTAQTIIDAINVYYPRAEIYVCGGGVHNDFLMKRLRELAVDHDVYTTEKLGVHPDYVEAIAFAWLAKQTLEKKPGNLMAVTGAKKETILGGIYYV